MNLVQKIRGMGVREEVGYTDTFASEKDDMLKFNTIISLTKTKRRETGRLISRPLCNSFKMGLKQFSPEISNRKCKNLKFQRLCGKIF